MSERSRTAMWPTRRNYLRYISGPILVTGFAGCSGDPGGTRPAGSGGPGVTIVSTDGDIDLAVKPAVELVRDAATPEQPPRLQTTLTNTGDEAVVVAPLTSMPRPTPTAVSRSESIASKRPSHLSQQMSNRSPPQRGGSLSCWSKSASYVLTHRVSKRSKSQPERLLKLLTRRWNPPRSQCDR